MNAHGGQRTAINIILQKSSTTILRNSLSLPWILSSTIVWLISKALRILLSLCLSSVGIITTPPCLDFSVVSGD